MPKRRPRPIVARVVKKHVSYYHYTMTLNCVRGITENDSSLHGRLVIRGTGIGKPKSQYT